MPSAGSISGARLRLARMFHGWTQAELAEKIGVSKVYVSYLEAEQKHPTPILLQALADTVGFAPEFFTGTVLDEFRDDQCNFRRRQTTPLMLRNRVLAYGTLLGMVVDRLEEEVEFESAGFPEPEGPIRTNEDIERFAEKCRRFWGHALDTPITNMIRVLELAGVLVTRLTFEGTAQKIDAFSRAGKRHVVVLNSDKGSPSRSVFDAAHECGHLGMHIGLEAGSPELEQQADRFASAFLLPRVGLLREFPRTQHFDWDQLLKLKARWRVSLAALIRRAYDLQLIDAAQYQRAFRFLRWKGWDKGEPGESDAEEPTMIRTALEALKPLNISAYDVAKELHLSPEVFERVTGIPVEPPSRERPVDNVISIDFGRRRLPGL